MHSTSNHENLSKATILLVEKKRTIVTDDNGDFVFDDLCAGNYTIKLSHINYDSLERKFSVTTNVHLDFDLTPAINALNKVTVTTIRGIQNTGTKKELTAKDLDETKGQSLAEALSKASGVTMLQSGSNVSKPVIHGLHSNRILTINNGVRQEGQQWGNEHAPEIDPFIAGKLVVIQGVDELRYGSDAVGGVILIEPKPLRITPGYNAEINAGYFSNNRQYVTSAVFEEQLNKYPSITYRLQGTLKNGANATTPNYRLNNTGLQEKNFSATVASRGEHFNSEIFYSYFNTKVGIFTGSHIGNLTDLKKAIEASRPADVFINQNTNKIARPSQSVIHQLLKWKSKIQAGAQKFNVLVAGQYNSRKEFDIVRNQAIVKPQVQLDILTLSEDVNWEPRKKNNLSGLVGISSMQQFNSYAGRYFIPSYKSYTIGGYAIEKWNKDSWEIQGGIRYDHKNINTNRLLTNGTVFDQYNFSFSTFGSSLNVGYKLGTNWMINSNISLASRAPHVNELLSNGIHHGTATYEQGDVNLKPEKSVNVSLNSNFNNIDNTLSVEVSLYSNSIQNFIYQQPKPEQPVLTIAGAFPKLVYEQTNALLQGVDLTTSYKFYKRIDWLMKLSVLRATNKVMNDWLIRMPADRISNSITYNLKDNKGFKNSYLSAEVQNVSKQNRVPNDSHGQQDYKEPPGGYTLLNANFSTSFQIKKLPVTVGITAKNLLNKSYRDYLNSMRYFADEVGRNIGIRLQISLEHLYNKK